jgi:hypothetical protein
MRSTALLILMAVVLTVGGAPAAAKDKNKSIEQYQANSMATGGGGRSSMIEINIYGWSAEEDRAEALEAIQAAYEKNKRNRNRSVAQALRGLPKVGYVFFAGQQGWPIRYSRVVDMGDGNRRILLATDRPVSFREAYANSQFGDFDVTMIELTVDASGNGSGVLSLGTEVVWNKETEKLEVTNVSSQPVRLENVRPAH